MTEDEMVGWHHRLNGYAASAAKSLQSCLTLVWVNSGSWGWTETLGALQLMESQIVGHN